MYMYTFPLTHLLRGHRGLHHDALVGVVVGVVAREEVARRLELHQFASLVPAVAAPALRTAHQKAAPLYEPEEKLAVKIY